MSLNDFLDYEIRSSKIAPYVSNKYIQSFLGWYYAKKTLRKYKAYKKSIEIKNKINGK